MDDPPRQRSGRSRRSCDRPGDHRVARSRAGLYAAASCVMFCEFGAARADASRRRHRRLSFQASGQSLVGATLETLDAACGENTADQADLILVTSQGDPELAAADIRSIRPDLRAATNEQMIARFQESGFTYFRQISTVLTTVTLTFAVLLITVLLTVSVNQRLGEIAALRALGLSQWRVVADVLCESALMVGTGGFLSLPIGALLATWLDGILKAMPEIPVGLHFFVFEPGALATHLALIVATALIAAVYPMFIVARLPIAATLRSEVTS